MKTVVGIFPSRVEAIKGANRLQSLGFESSNVVVLSPGAAPGDIEAVPAEDAEQPGMGKAVGSVIGGAMGLGAGAIAASFLLPGIGPVVAMTFGAAAVGIGGAVAGGAVGGALEEIFSNGVPKDEVFFYEDALRQGRAVVIGLSERDDQIETAHEALKQSGAESLDAAREKWWIGLKDTEETLYAQPKDFKNVEKTYRRGFAAALEPGVRGRSPQDANAYLRANYPQYADDENFRCGFERGQMYYHSLPRRDQDRERPERNATRS